MNELDMLNKMDDVNGESFDNDNLSPEVPEGQNEVDDPVTDTNDIKILQLDSKTVKTVVVGIAAGGVLVWEGGKWVYKKAVKPLAKKTVKWVKTTFGKKADIVVAETTTPSGESTVQAATPVEEQQ